MNPSLEKSKTPKTDCKWYQGYIPCRPHKEKGYSCQDCQVYEPLKERILIIKLGAAGDVIRTTPLLRRLRNLSSQTEITWLTYYPDLVPSEWVNRILSFDLKNITWLQAQEFSWLINLDKDGEAIALASRIKAKKKSGFGMDAFGKCKPFRGESEIQKWLTGLWDDLNKANTKSYLDEIFEICGFQFEGEEYILEKTTSKAWKKIEKDKTVIGLNTGCGTRWTTRLWKEEYWITLITELQKSNFEIVLLGGPDEHAKNVRIARETSAKYFGFFELPVFIDLVDQCDMVITQVTMALHIAVGLKKTLILMNNIFNKNEFHLYGRGCIIQPDLDCLGCFKQKFDDRCPVEDCMDLIKPELVVSKIKEILIYLESGKTVE